MTYTINDVGNRPGRADLTDAEKQVIADEWNTPEVILFADKMTASDAILSRTEEDLADAITALGGSLPAALATKVADKKLLRSNG